MIVGIDRTTAAALLLFYFFSSEFTHTQWLTHRQWRLLANTHTHTHSEQWETWIQRCWIRLACNLRHLVKLIVCQSRSKELPLFNLMECLQSTLKTATKWNNHVWHTAWSGPDNMIPATKFSKMKFKINITATQKSENWCQSRIANSSSFLCSHVLLCECLPLHTNPCNFPVLDDPHSILTHVYLILLGQDDEHMR